MQIIVFISVGQPSTNPRLVKEANALQEAGYKVYVIYSFWTKWAVVTDKQLFTQVAWTPILAGGSPLQNRLLYFFTRLRNKLARLIAKNIILKFGVAEVALGRTYPELLKKATAIKADLYIAHIQAALPAAVKAAKKNNAKCGFDAEDMHRYEVSNDEHSLHFKLAKHIADCYIPQVNQLTTSSPLISAVYQQLYPTKNPLTLLNVFPKISLKLAPHQKPLKLFWFSQTIGPDRGLEVVAEAFKQFNASDIELHLLGHISDYNGDVFIGQTFADAKNVFIHAPIPPDRISEFAAQFDIGLASETGTPYNRDICLTNKIFTYIQSGLAVIASDTKAQSIFLQEYPDCGLLYRKADIESLTENISYYINHAEHLYRTRQYNFELGQSTLNWENESRQFLRLVADTLR